MGTSQLVPARGLLMEMRLQESEWKYPQDTENGKHMEKRKGKFLPLLSPVQSGSYTGECPCGRLDQSVWQKGVCLQWLMLLRMIPSVQSEKGQRGSIAFCGSYIYIYKNLPLYYDMNASERLVLKRKVFIKDLVSRKYWMSRSWRGEMTSSLSFAWPGSLCSHGFRIEPNHCHQSQYFLRGKWLKTPRHMSTHFVFNATLYYWNIYFQYISRWVW